MCLIHQCDELSCASRVTFNKPELSSSKAEHAPAPPVTKDTSMNNISPELAHECVESDSNEELQHNCHSDSIKVPTPHHCDVNHQPISAHRQMSDDKCEGMEIGGYKDKYRIMELINRGSFGRVYRAVRVNTGEIVAVKAEDQGTGHEKIMSEANLCRKLVGCAGIPEVFWYGMYGSDFNFMVMDFLGPNLLELEESYGSNFSLQTILKILMDLLPTLKYLHDHNIMHRDISPRNIVIGRGDKKEQVYLIDFGLAKRCTKQGQMCLRSPFGDYCNAMVGTPRYASINSHRGGVGGRSDDLESLGYVLVFLLTGSLPWMEEVTDDVVDGIRFIGHKKVVTPIEEVCKGIPDQFATLISYSRLLKYYEMPDYRSITTLFVHLIKDLSIDLTAPFDWERSGKDGFIIPRLKVSKPSLARIHGGSDDTTISYLCSHCTTETHSICKSN